MPKNSTRPAIVPVSASIAYIPLTRGYYSLVDREDAEWLQHNKWQMVPWSGVPYAVRNIKHRQVGMHRLIANTPKGLFTDHVNGVTLDNRRCNLRVATNQQNNANTKRRRDNTTGMKGTTFNKRMGKYIAQISSEGQRIHIGCYDTTKDAHAAYAAKARELHGEFLRLG